MEGNKKCQRIRMEDGEGRKGERWRERERGKKNKVWKNKKKRK